MESNKSTVPTMQRVVAILWPSFVMSGVATILFFTLFDPEEIVSCVGGYEMTRLGYYSVGFFLFWGLTSINSILTCYFLKPCDQ